jgi:hypothetical protein
MSELGRAAADQLRMLLHRDRRVVIAVELNCGLSISGICFFSLHIGNDLRWNPRFGFLIGGEAFVIFKSEKNYGSRHFTPYRYRTHYQSKFLLSLFLA